MAVPKAKDEHRPLGLCDSEDDAVGAFENEYLVRIRKRCFLHRATALCERWFRQIAFRDTHLVLEILRPALQFATHRPIVINRVEISDGGIGDDYFEARLKLAAPISSPSPPN